MKNYYNHSIEEGSKLILAFNEPNTVYSSYKQYLNDREIDLSNQFNFLEEEYRKASHLWKHTNVPKKNNEFFQFFHFIYKTQY